MMNRVKIYWVNFTSEIYELRIRNQMSERAAFFFHAFQKWEGKVHVHKPFNLTYYILVYFYFLCYFPAEKCVSTAMTGALNYKRNETKNETKKKNYCVLSRHLQNRNSFLCSILYGGVNECRSKWRTVDGGTVYVVGEVQPNGPVAMIRTQNETIR